MNWIKSLGLVVITTSLFSCGSKLSENYHMEKRYWTISDYDDALTQMEYLTPEEGLPRLSDPLTAPVFEKLVDKENVSIILEDEQLGLKYRDEQAQLFFDTSKKIFEIYQVLDIQDKYIYQIEFVRAISFFLHTQILYFKVGNTEMLKNAVDPESSEIKNLVNHNEQCIVSNFNLELKLLSKEDQFNEDALKEYAEVINIYFSKLIDEFPSANYNEIKETASSLSKKVKSQEIKLALENLIQKINTKKI